MWQRSRLVILAWGLVGCSETPGDADPVVDAEVLGPLGDGVATLSGSSRPDLVDGPRGQARFSNPVNVLVAPDGRAFVADYDNHAVRVLHVDGATETLVRQADFQRPFGLALAGETLYVQTDRNDALEQDRESGTIWAVSIHGGTARVVARDLGRPRGLAALPDGRLVLVDNQHHTVRLLAPGDETPMLLAGANDEPGFRDATRAEARFDTPGGVVVDARGDLIVADRRNHRLRRVTLAGEVTTLAGSGARGWLDGYAASASFDEPAALALGDDSAIYVAEAGNYCVRRVDVDGVVVRLAGDRRPGFADGDPLAAHFHGLEGLAVTPDGAYLYVADGTRGEDLPFHRVRRVGLREGGAP